jgi:hypothetical protein
VVGQKIPQEHIDAEKDHIDEEEEGEVTAEQGLALDDGSVLLRRMIVPKHVEKRDCGEITNTDGRSR